MAAIFINNDTDDIRSKLTRKLLNADPQATIEWGPYGQVRQVIAPNLTQVQLDNAINNVRRDHPELFANF